MKIRSFFVILTIIIISIVSWKVVSKTPELVYPNDSFQERYEHKLTETLQQFLEKHLHPSTFLITTDIILEPITEKSSQTQTPKRIQTKRTETYSSQYAPLFSQRPSAASIKYLHQNGLKLPGLIQNKINQQQPLPGFPSLKETQLLKDHLIEKETSQPKTDKMDLNETNEKVYFNIKNNRTKTADDSIKSRHIHITYDQSAYALSKIAEQDISQLLEPIIQLQPQDTLQLFPSNFTGVRFIIYRFLLKYHATYLKALAFFNTFDWVFALLIVSSPLIATLIAIPYYLIKRRQFKAKQAKKRQEMEIKEQQQRSIQRQKDYHKKRKALAKLSQEKPETLAHFISNLIQEPTESS